MDVGIEWVTRKVWNNEKIRWWYKQMIESNDEEYYNYDREWWRVIVYVCKEITTTGNDEFIL